ncbi:Sorting nexin-33 [Cichlidogyrus casuarinus]|uniref:Sorting nexin-33 n=1 Tax=Cichlidogyrus casuarinus TaxID=1844966 RepID=A0ABD2QP59_9PLAT
MLKDSFQQLGKMYDQVSQAHVAQENLTEADALIETLREYEGINSQLGKLSSLAKSTTQLLEEGNKAVTENKMSYDENEQLREKSTVIGRSVMAEFHHLAESRHYDWAVRVQSYLQEKANFYREISQMYERTAQVFGQTVQNPTE